GDGRWSEFCGAQRNRSPHKLRESELRAMLRPLGIITHSVWPGKGKPGDHSGKGYTCADFEAAWRDYCDETGEDETGKSARILPLRKAGSARNRDLPVCRISYPRAYPRAQKPPVSGQKHAKIDDGLSRRQGRRRLEQPAGRRLPSQEPAAATGGHVHVD